MSHQQHSSALLGLEDPESLIPGLLKLNLGGSEVEDRPMKENIEGMKDPPKGTPEFVPKPGELIVSLQARSKADVRFCGEDNIGEMHQWSGHASAG